MHIPDGFLATPVLAATAAVSVPAVLVAARRARRELDESKVPMMGVLGAFVFAAQMVNFPVGAGTSGHLVGCTLLAATLGPSAAVVVMTAILALQALVFQDGGLLALGANLLNMAVAGTLAGYLSWRALGGRRVGLLAGGFISVAVAALLCLGELSLSGVRFGHTALLVALGAVALNAVMEGLITMAVAGALEGIRPGWLRAPAAQSRPVLWSMGAVAIVLGAVGLFLASTAPDGLERLGAATGLPSLTHFHAPLADYTLALSAAWAGRAVAGLAGVALAAVACFALARWLARWRNA
jgi:cobalt/nickel transport system permease protein